MIRSIFVDGFKTLTDFKIEINPGLNILVGPNGAGKTNIISFFEFLGHLQDMNISNAISSVGGASSVFRKIGSDAFQANIRSSVVGINKISSRRYLYYQFDFNIAVYESESIIYDYQRLMLKYRSVDSISNYRIKPFDLDIEKRIDENFKSTTKIYDLNDKKFRSYPLSRREESKEQTQLRIKHILNEYLGPDDSLLKGMRSIFREIRYLFSDIYGGKIFNIVPSKVKIPEDSAQKPGIRKDGAGLYSTLYAMKKNETNHPRRAIGFHYYDDFVDIGNSTIPDVLHYVQLANDAIENIEVLNNPFDNQLQVRITISGKDGSSVLPLSSMSDGTIKWISLITILLTNRSIFSIEEPENYLHPLMQTEIVSVMRSLMRTESFILMSTHSETILNSAKPNELIVISFSEGRTIANRPQNAKELSVEIQRTGFGLGYYYIAGSLDNE